MTTLPSDSEPTAPETETKADAFKRLANYRVQKAIDRLDLIGNLSNRSSYEYTEDQVDRIVVALDEALTRLHNRFKQTKETKETFTL